MTDRRACAILGFQIVFLTFAVVLLTAPVDKYVLGRWQWAQDLGLPLERLMIFVIIAFPLIAIDPLRRRCASLLAVPITAQRHREIAIGIALVLLVDFGCAGGFALWNWLVGGEAALVRAMGAESKHAANMDASLSTHGIVFFLIFAATIGPIIEELVFRGMLYPTWRDAWGWVAGAVATSIAFGLFHGLFWPQLLGSLVFVCVLRKTGSLRGAIYVHAASNFLLWYPALGQFLLPSERSTGELHLWTLHLACLALIVALLPWYMWSARDACLPRE
jgi:membrane protease YdiL (CAAX protease family)